MKKIKFLISLFLLFTITLSFNIKAEEAFSVNEHTITDLNGVKYEYLDITKANGKPGKIFHASVDPTTSEYEMVVADASFENSWVNEDTLTVAQQFERATGRKVIAAVNGDFFYYDGNDGYTKPTGAYVKDGIIYKFGNYNAFAFNNQGEFRLGSFPEQDENWTIKIVVDTGAETKEILVDKVNEAPLDGEVAVFLGQNQSYTMSTPNTAKYLMKVNEDIYGEPDWEYFRPVNGFAYRLVKGSQISSEDVMVREGFVGIEINDETLQSWFYDNYNICTTTVKLYKHVAGEFANFQHIMSGRRILVDDGVPKTVDSGSHETTSHPRTTIGITTDGRFFITALDGRDDNWSQGFPSTLQAAVAKYLGAQYALELDGGGSTTFVLRVNDELKVMNHPSDGSLRNDANHVLIVEKTPSLTPETSETQNMSTKPSDSCYIEDRQENELIQVPIDNNKFDYSLILILSSGLVVVIGTVTYIKRK